MSIAIITSRPNRNQTAGGFAASSMPQRLYWDDRARRFAGRGAGLAAVCSYGMPWFYNGSIDLLQYLALRRWLRVRPGTTVLELGCGVGRWSRRLAKRGAAVTGIDLSQAMVVEARRRARAERLNASCRFLVSDLCAPAIVGRFDVVFAVTVLQHQLDAKRFEASVHSIAEHLAPGGRAILLEAAPSRLVERCNTPVFVAREERTYLDAFDRAGLRRLSTSGVDPAPFKTWFLPHYRGLPRPLAVAALTAVTVGSFPIDLVVGRHWARASWHKVFVLEHDQPGGRR